MADAGTPATEAGAAATAPEASRAAPRPALRVIIALRPRGFWAAIEGERDPRWVPMCAGEYNIGALGAISSELRKRASADAVQVILAAPPGLRSTGIIDVLRALERHHLRRIAFQNEGKAPLSLSLPDPARPWPPAAAFCREPATCGRPAPAGAP